MRSALLALAAAVALPGSAVAAPHATPDPPASAGDEPEVLLAGMGLGDKVGQVLMITAGGARLGRAARRFLRRVRPGGVALFRYHLRRPHQIRRLTRALRRAVGPIPPFVAVDHEGGPVVRIRRGMPRLPPNRVFGVAGEAELAERAGRLVGAALNGLGINLNLAPVLDVPRGRGGRYLRRRALGGAPALAARLGAAYLRGLRAAGVTGVAKHFPGEGSSRGDPHRRLPVAAASATELQEVDLVPFRGARPEAVMVGHVVYPALDPRRRPASLSPPVYRLLREDLGFDGLALTDGLEMRGVRARFDVGRAAVEALRAGADMVSIFWSPRQIRRARTAILRAVRSGRLPRERLDQAVRRVLAAKKRWGLWSQRSAPTGAKARASAAAGRRALRGLRVDLGRAAARLVRGASLWPLPAGAVVLSRDREVLRVAAQRGVDLRRTPRAATLRRAVAAGLAVVAGRSALRWRRTLRRAGVRVLAIVGRSPKSARRVRADGVVAAWDRHLVAGAVAAVLSPRAPKFWRAGVAAKAEHVFTAASAR